MRRFAFWGSVTENTLSTHRHYDENVHRIKQITRGIVFDPPHPRGVSGGYLLVKNLSRRTAPKFDTHVRIDTLTLKKLTHPTPGGFRGLSIVKKSFAIISTPQLHYFMLLCTGSSHGKSVQGPIRL